MRQAIMLVAMALGIAGYWASSQTEAAAKDVRDRLTSEVLVGWNQRVFSAAEAEDGFLTLKGLRTAAMMHLAIHDALNSIDPRYATYLPVEPVETADPLAAVASAAHAVALDQYPEQAGQFDEELSRWLGGREEAPARVQGIEAGRRSAERILAARRGDGWDNEAEYQWHPMGPGVYAEFAEHSGTPEGFVFGSGWATAAPFMLESPSQFRSPPPPEITSAEYTSAFLEVKELGRHESASRTPDQSHLAMWWKDFAENSHNRLARQLASEGEMELWDGARMFALLNMGIYDAYVNVFENKFHFNHWRPYTAIRWAANDGNPDTEPDAEWNNLHRHTYAFPSYPSAHGTACAAAMTVLADSFGDDHPFTMTTAAVDEAGPFSGKIAMDPPTREFDSFSSAAMECAMSRLYLGIHFRYDSVAGNELGGSIGEYAVEGFLQPSGQ